MLFRSVRAIIIREGDELIRAELTSGNDQLMIATRNGRCVRFHEEQARPLGRTSSGVRGIKLADGDEVVGMIKYSPDAPEAAAQRILVVSENGFGKKTGIEEYTPHNRGTMGMKAMNITEKTGKLVALRTVTEDNDLMIINQSGLTIRMAVSDIRETGRVAQGVKLINIKEGDTIAALSVVASSKEEEQPAGAQESAETPETTENE